MPVAPADPDPVGTDRLQVHELHVVGDIGRIEQGATGHLIDTGGAGTGEPQRTRRVAADMARAPRDLEMVGHPSDGGGYHRSVGHDALPGC